MSIAKRSLNLTGMFEAEVLVELLLWRWDHPFKNDAEFRNDLLENAAAALKAAIDGEKLFDDLPASETNFIAAIYFAEWSALNSSHDDPDGSRQKWLSSLQKSIPSCFCAQRQLPPSGRLINSLPIAAPCCAMVP